MRLWSKHNNKRQRLRNVTVCHAPLLGRQGSCLFGSIDTTSRLGLLASPHGSTSNVDASPILGDGHVCSGRHDEIVVFVCLLCCLCVVDRRRSVFMRMLLVHAAFVFLLFRPRHRDRCVACCWREIGGTFSSATEFSSRARETARVWVGSSPKNSSFL